MDICRVRFGCLLFRACSGEIVIHGLNKKTTRGNYFIRPNQWIFVSTQQALIYEGFFFFFFFSFFYIS